LEKSGPLGHYIILPGTWGFPAYFCGINQALKNSVPFFDL
jgi:hypothetical protein